MTSRLNFEKAQTLISTKNDLYEGLFRNGWCLPKKSDTCMTVDYLSDVFRGTVFRIKTSEVQPRNCLTPPGK
jgi:hypothetical protein